MSDQRPEFDADDMASSGAPAGGFSSNGTYPEAAVGVAESAEAEETETAATAPDEPASAAPESTATESTAAEPAPDEGTSFLAELARAMQAAAGLERQRVAEDADRRREEHLALIQARRETEAATMRDLAAEELKGIDAWADGERQRIDVERERRAAALQEDLEASLTQHGSKIDQEIEGVEATIAGYRTEVDGFFATLEQETDPVEIARHAGRRPPFPDLDAVGMIEPEPDQPAVGVMDPEAEADPAVAWSHWNETSAPTDVAEASAEVAEASAEVAEASAEPTEPAAEGEALEPEAVTVAAPGPAPEEPASGTLLQSVPAHRPFSWLRGDRDEDQ